MTSLVRCGSGGALDISARSEVGRHRSSTGRSSARIALNRVGTMNVPVAPPPPSARRVCSGSNDGRISSVPPKNTAAWAKL